MDDYLQRNREPIEFEPTRSEPTEMDKLLAAFQLETRELAAESLVIWKATLARYPIEEVREAIVQFIQTKTREEARGVVVGDVLKLIDQNRERKYRLESQGESARKMEQWRREMEDSMRSDPEGFEQARKAFKDKLAELARKKAM